MALPVVLAAIIPALVPVLSDGIRAVFNRVTNGAGANPTNVEEAVKLMAAETERLKAIAELDKPSEKISTWVADLRASFRYIAAGLIVTGGVLASGVLVLAPVFGVAITPDLAAFIQGYNEGMVMPVFSFLFGQRMWMGMRK